MALRFRLLTAIFSFLFVSVGGIPRATAEPITWNLVETSCFSDDNGCMNLSGTGPIALPLTLGSITGSGTYIDKLGACGWSLCYTLTTSGDFELSLPNGVPSNPDFGPYCTLVDFGDGACSVDVELKSGPSGVGGVIDFESHNDATNIGLSLNGLTFFGNWGADGSIEGCGSFANCEISGELVSTPEPSSLPILLAGLSLIGGAFYFGRKRVLAS